jgi:hypothetical protein
MIPMPIGLANAAQPDNSIDTIVFLAECVLLMGVTFGLAIVPVVLANRRNPRSASNIKALVVLWGMLACGTAIYCLMNQYQWSKTYTQRIMSGYYDASDPATTSDAPKQPWIMWGGLAVGYAALVIWSVGKPSRTS